MNKKSKIFGVGNMKTGTTSLTKALTILGFKSFHNVPRYEEAESRSGEKFPKEILDAYDAFSDWPFPGIYKEMDQQYPGSKFILTIRDLKPWLKSVKLHMLRNRLNPHYQGDLTVFDKKKLTILWKKRSEEICDYFKNRPEDFLIMDITAGDGWEKLCPFLNLPTPAQPFPHENITPALWSDYVRHGLRWLKNKWFSPRV